MTRKELLEKSSKNCLEYFLNFINEHYDEGDLADVLCLDMNMTGHAVERHVGKDMLELVERVCKEQRTASSFYDKETLNDILFEGIVSCSEKICKNFQEENGKGMEISVFMDKQIGYLVDTSLKGLTTSASKIIIEWSKDAYTDIGFVVKTAYPVIAKGHTEYMDYNFLREAKENGFLSKSNYIKSILKNSGFDNVHIFNHNKINVIMSSDEKNIVSLLYDCNTNSQKWKMNGQFVSENNVEKLISGSSFDCLKIIKDAISNFENPKLFPMLDFVDIRKSTSLLYQELEQIDCDFELL